MTATISALPGATLPVDAASLIELAVPNGVDYDSQKTPLNNLGIRLGSTDVPLQQVTSSVAGLTLTGSSVWNGTAIGLARGGTGTNLSATGGTARVLVQAAVGATITVRRLGATDLSDGTVGTGNIVLNTGPPILSPTLVTPVLGTPVSGTLTNCTGYPVGSLSGLGTGVAALLGGPDGVRMRAATSDYTGTGAFVFARGPTVIDGTLSGTTAVNGTLSVSGVIRLGGSGASFPALDRSLTEIRARLADGSGFAGFEALSVTTHDPTAMITSGVALNDGAGAGAGTLANAPSAGDPAKWIPIDDNGTVRYIPTWT